MNSALVQEKFIYLAEQCLRESELEWLRQMIAKEKEMERRRQFQVVADRPTEIVEISRILSDSFLFP